MLPDIGYIDDEGRFCKVEHVADPIMPRLSDRMRVVLFLFFQSEGPFELYGESVQDTTDEEDAAFDAEVVSLREWLAGRGKIKA